MKKTVPLIFAALYVFLCAIVPASITANANSAPEFWSGSFSGGAAVIDGECPVRVESELLTFNIDEFPQNYYDDTVEDVEKFLSYSGRVTARYEFYNPAEYSVDVTLAFPFGNSPDYAYYYGGIDDTAKYSVTADGEKVETKLRHTLACGSFEAETDVGRLVDGFKEDAFYSPEKQVYIYRFTVGGIAYSGDNAVHAEIDIYKTEGRKVLSASNGYSSLNGGCTLSWFVRNGDEIVIYSVGKPMNDDEFDFRFCYYGRYNKKTSVQGSAERNKEKDEVITFKELALALRDKSKSGVVSETDWYNAAVENLHMYEDEGGFISFNSLYLEYRLMRWYEYSLTVPAGGRLVNEVTAPVYPDINGGYSPSIYNYEYLLSPAKSWAGFGPLEVRVNTPFFLLKNKNFERTEYGYVYRSDGLPDGELTFTLCTVENPESGFGCAGIASVIPYLIVPLAILLGIAAVVTGLTLLIIFLVKSGKNKNQP